MTIDADGLRIVVCDARPLVREQLSSYLRRQPGVARVEVVAEGDEAVRAVRRGADVLVLDVRHLGATSAPEVLEALANLGSPAPVLLLGIPDDMTAIVRAVVTAPIAILRSEVRLPTLFDVIEQVVQGNLVLPDSIVAPVISRVAAERRKREENASILASLTERERTVLRMLSSGLRRSEIADALGLSPNTVRTHLAHVMQKLGTHTQILAAMRGRELFSDHMPAVITLADDAEAGRPLVRR
jgi:DNA-binding NarL/FixJ family response regulator